jgi:hypothetical protein
MQRCSAGCTPSLITSDHHNAVPDSCAPPSYPPQVLLKLQEDLGGLVLPHVVVARHLENVEQLLLQYATWVDSQSLACLVPAAPPAVCCVQLPAPARATWAVRPGCLHPSLAQHSHAAAS